MIYLNIRSLSLPPFLFLKFKSLRRHILYSHPTHNLPTYTQPAYIYTTYLHTHNLHTYTQPTYIYTTYLHTHNLPIHHSLWPFPSSRRGWNRIMWHTLELHLRLRRYLPIPISRFSRSQCGKKKFCSQSYKCHCLAPTIALWFRLCLPSCGRGFESQATPSKLFQFELLKL